MTNIIHFDVKYQFVRENIHKHHICIEHVSIDCILTNPLMKGLAIQMYHDHVKSMNLINFMMLWVSGSFYV